MIELIQLDAILYNATSAVFLLDALIAKQQKKTKSKERAPACHRYFHWLRAGAKTLKTLTACDAFLTRENFRLVFKIDKFRRGFWYLS